MDISNNYGYQLSEKIRSQTDDYSKLSKFEKFTLDRGYKYATENALQAAYARLLKAQQGGILSRDEFDAELARNHSDQIYDILIGMVSEKKLKPIDLYRYARHGWCANAPEAIIAVQIEPNTYKVNSCDTVISEKDAKRRVAKEWGFDEKRIEIVETPYYDATDWQFIRFVCAGTPWLWADESLYMIYE